jgi:hypothetical protein
MCKQTEFVSGFGKQTKTCCSQKIKMWCELLQRQLKHENIHILHTNCMQPTGTLNISHRSLRCSGMLRGIDGQLLTNSFKTK